MTFWRPLTIFGVCWEALVPSGLHWSSQCAQMCYLALLCRREHRFREICWILGQRVGRPVAPCGGLLHPSRSPIEEDKMIRFKHPGTQILDSSCLGAWRVGFLDFSQPPGTLLAGLMASSGPCFEGWELERDWML